MQVDVNNSPSSHFWLIALWCGLGGVVLGTLTVISCWIRKCRSTYRKKKKKHVRRAQSVAEFPTKSSNVASNKRLLFRGRSVSSEQDISETEHSEKSPLVTAKLDSLAKLLFNKSLLQDNSGFPNPRECETPTRHPSTRYQYTALDNGIGATDRNPKERAARDRALTACQEWIQTTDGRYEIIAHLDDIGSRPNKQWFLLNDLSVRTDRLMTLLPLPPDCTALDELPTSENPQGILMELLGSLQHPYVYPVLDLGFPQSESHRYVCLVMPFNPRGSLKDLIYKSQWNEPWNRKYTRKSSCLPISQVQRLGRQILEALLFLRERGFPSHGHLHSGNVILQNGVARLSGLENGLLGLNSRVNAVNWSKTDADNIDVICFGHLLFEMCAGYELGIPQPSPAHLELELERYPQVADILSYIFDSPDGKYPTIEDLVVCDLFRNIDLREMRGTCIPSFKHGLSDSTLSLLNAVRRRQAIFSGSLSEGSSPCTPPSTPRDRRTGESSDMSSSESDGTLDEIVIEPLSTDPTFYGSFNSPIHFCDNIIKSDEINNSHVQFINANEEIISVAVKLEEPPMEMGTSLSKNSKSRRMEYSMMRSGIRRSAGEDGNNFKLQVSGNPSQDSAFGSMTDGDISIGSMSIRLNSFQSITSPIDEGVEDFDEENLVFPSCPSSPASSKNCDPDSEQRSHSSNSYNSAGEGSSASNENSPYISRPSTSQSSFGQERNSFLKPPRNVFKNNQRSQHSATSPSKKSPRGSSLDDVPSTSKTKMKTLSLKANTCCTLDEEEQFQIIFSSPSITSSASQLKSQSSNYLDRMNTEMTCNTKGSIPKTEKYKKLTHASFSTKITNPITDKNQSWKFGKVDGKCKLVKSNESLVSESNLGIGISESNSISTNRIGRVHSINEISVRQTASTSKENNFLRFPKKSRSEKYLFPLKSNRISYTSCYFDDDSCGSDLLKDDDDDDVDDDENVENDLSPTHSEACKSIGGIVSSTTNTEQCDSDENVPLLQEMEMSQITSSNDSEESL